MDAENTRKSEGRRLGSGFPLVGQVEHPVRQPALLQRPAGSTRSLASFPHPAVQSFETCPSPRDGETFKVGDTSVRVFATPGHTAGSAAYLINGVLFVGDSADVSRDGEIRGAPWIFSDSQEQNRASLRRLADRLAQERIDVRAIVPAHSGVVEGLAPLTAFARADAP